MSDSISSQEIAEQAPSSIGNANAAACSPHLHQHQGILVPQNVDNNSVSSGGSILSGNNERSNIDGSTKKIINSGSGSGSVYHLHANSPANSGPTMEQFVDLKQLVEQQQQQLQQLQQQLQQICNHLGMQPEITTAPAVSNGLVKKLVYTFNQPVVQVSDSFKPIRAVLHDILVQWKEQKVHIETEWRNVENAKVVLVSLDVGQDDVTRIKTDFETLLTNNSVEWSKYDVEETSSLRVGINLLNDEKTIRHVKKSDVIQSWLNDVYQSGGIPMNNGGMFDSGVENIPTSTPVVPSAFPATFSKIDASMDSVLKKYSKS